jgi:formylmethanofuran dehydrogenase subunit E
MIKDWTDEEYRTKGRLLAEELRINDALNIIFEYRDGAWHGPEEESSLIKVICHQCGAEVVRYKSQVVGRVFCSQKCSKEYREPKVDNSQ